jgi:hypothetical protein
MNKKEVVPKPILRHPSRGIDAETSSTRRYDFEAASLN